MKELVFKEDFGYELTTRSNHRTGVESRKENISKNKWSREYSDAQRQYNRYLTNLKNNGTEEEKRKVSEIKKDADRRGYYKLPKEFSFREYDYKKIFEKGQRFAPKKGLTVMVGENGCGKSTLIKEFSEHNGGFSNEEKSKRDMWGKKVDILLLDFEKLNKTIKYNPFGRSEDFKKAFFGNITRSEESHGERLMDILSLAFDEKVLEYELLILDEPEQGMSLGNQYMYLKLFQKLSEKIDIILVTHSKVMIENISEVFDVETMSYVPSKEYLERFEAKIKQKFSEF